MKKFNQINISLFLILIFTSVNVLYAQSLESITKPVKLGRLWGGVCANGDKGSFDFTVPFFPSDYDILQYRGQNNDNFFGSGFKLACTNFHLRLPSDSIMPAAVYGPVNDWLPNGKVIVPLTSYSRYKYPVQTVNGSVTPVTDFATYDPSQFTGGTYDQILSGTYRNILGVDVNRKVFIWGQNFNDDYVIVDVELTNTGIPGKTLAGADTVFQDTLHNFYFNIQQELNNNYYSYGSNPAPSTSEQPKYNYVWQHYFGGRTGDSLRVFYFYNADDPANSGDQMGSPIVTQKGRLVNTDFVYYTILHASLVPYSNSAQDIDDFLQPKVTYIGTDTKIPNPGAGEDPYGSPNYWAISGGFSDDYKMSGNVYSGTHHGLNNDELGTPDFSNFVAGTTAAAASRNFSSFGPYDFPFGQKLHFVYASGINGIGIKKSKEIGEMWQNGTLQNPPGMPDSILGWLPSNFVFPSGASEMDKRKDRWISMGKDSIMRSAWRAKWNYDHNYQIPQTPPPPDQITITGFGDGIQVQWSDAAAENLPNFAGYRVMRKLSDVDTLFYEEVYSSGPEDKAAMHAFKDKVIFGAEYFYYVQSKALIDPNDQNADPTTRGKIIFSNRNFVPNTDWVNPPSPSTDDMSKIRVVPNPYNINDPLLFGFADQRHIDFRNLPPVCTIKVFTENGDLVQTIQHNRPVEKDGHEPWDLLTANQQVIMSGVYIAVFQKPSGEISYQKFVVVR